MFDRHGNRIARRRCHHSASCRAVWHPISYQRSGNENKSPEHHSGLRATRTSAMKKTQASKNLESGELRREYRFDYSKAKPNRFAAQSSANLINMTSATETRTISVAHSPDSDDAFMFYALATNKLDTGDIQFTHVLKDIQSLNEIAREGVYDVTAISFHAYAYIADKYALLPHGASIGDNYGPIVVSRELHAKEELSKLKVAIPGTLTSAFLALRIFNSEFSY